jgi:hypothetical protein
MIIVDLATKSAKVILVIPVVAQLASIVVKVAMFVKIKLKIKQNNKIGNFTL